LPRDALADHVRVCEAIAAGDAADAREAMSELLRLALADMGLSLRAP
jgi:DNA-binding FadR family transcriptional regulator